MFADIITLFIILMATFFLGCKIGYEYAKKRAEKIMLSYRLCSYGERRK